MEIRSRDIFICDYSLIEFSVECFKNKIGDCLFKHRRLSSLLNDGVVSVYFYDFFTAEVMNITYNRKSIYKANICKRYHPEVIQKTFDQFMSNMLFVIYDEIIKRNRCGKLTTKGGCLL